MHYYMWDLKIHYMTLKGKETGEILAPQSFTNLIFTGLYFHFMDGCFIRNVVGM